MLPTTCPAGAESLAGPPTVVHFAGARVALDEDAVYQSRDSLLAVAGEQGQSPVRLDFGNVCHVSGAALGAVVALHRALLAGGRRLTVYDLGPEVYEAFVAAGLDGFLDLRPAGRGDGAGGPGPPPEPGGGVLVVDDDAAVRSLLEAGLRHAGLRVWPAAGGREAVEVCRANPGAVGVALLDVRMPEMDGPLVLAVLLKLCPALRWCFMTGGAGPYSEQALLRCGAARVFPKPFALADVIETVRRLAAPAPAAERWIELPPQGA